MRAAEIETELMRLGAASGIRFRFDLIQRIPNTRFSHLLLALAGRHGRQSEVKERIMRAYFEEGVNIGEVDELVRLGAEVGLPEEQSRHTLIIRAGQDGVVAAQRHATLLGITGVPSFIFDGQYTISGAQEVAIFAQVLDQIAQLSSGKENSA
jgi:predicted DsbA family dithiol-disulfide isomerase